MVFTKHGYHIPGSPSEGMPMINTNCGGLLICGSCNTDVYAWRQREEAAIKDGQENPVAAERYMKVTIILDNGESVVSRTFPKTESVMIESSRDPSNFWKDDTTDFTLNFTALPDPTTGSIYEEKRE